MHMYIFFFVYIIVSKRGGTFAFFVDVVVLKIKQTYNDSDLSIAFLSDILLFFTSYKQH